MMKFAAALPLLMKKIQAADLSTIVEQERDGMGWQKNN